MAPPLLKLLNLNSNANAEQATLHLLTVVAGLVLAVQHYMQIFGQVKDQDKHESDMAPPKKNGVEEGSKNRKYSSLYPHVRFVSAGLFQSQPVATSSFALVRCVTLLSLLFGTVGASVSCQYKDASTCHLEKAVNSCLKENDGNGTCPIFAASNDTTTGRPYGTMSEWDVSRVTEFFYLFNEKINFNGDVSKWNTAKVRTMFGTFEGAYAFNGDLSKWDTSQVHSFSKTFWGAYAFNGDLSKWDTSKADDMKGMFWGASAFQRDVSKWDTALVVDMGYAFASAKAFNGDVSKWNTARVYYMAGSACSFLILL